jgi:hypothetical protein
LGQQEKKIFVKPREEVKPQREEPIEEEKSEYDMPTFIRNKMKK